MCEREKKNRDCFQEREREKGRKERVNENESKSVIEEKKSIFSAAQQLQQSQSQNLTFEGF